jgi:hypothetical protein
MTEAASETWWAQRLAVLGIAQATCLWRNPVHPNRRTYCQGGYVYKCNAPGPMGLGEHSGLAPEYRMLRQCMDLPGVPRPVRLLTDEDGEVAIYERIEGERLDHLHLTAQRKLRILAQLALTLARLSARGIAHNDVEPHNILVRPAGGCVLLDFGLAVRTPRHRAAYHNFLKSRLAHGKFYGSLRTLSRKLLSEELGRRGGGKWGFPGSFVPVETEASDSFAGAIISTREAVGEEREEENQDGFLS